MSTWQQTPAKSPVIKTNDSYDLIAADRRYSPDELESEVKATKYSVIKYKRIKPIPGTLGYLFRNLQGSNAAVIEHISNLIGGRNSVVGTGNTRYRKIKELIILWNNMDEFSRKRVDIFDHVCIQLGINRPLFWGWFQEACFDYDNIMAQTALSGYKNKFVELLKKHSELPKNQSDRRLMAETLKLTESQAPKIEVPIEVHNTTNIQHNEIKVEHRLPSFVKSIRFAEKEKLIENPTISSNISLLTEGTTEFIEAELVNESEEEKVLIAR